MSCIINKARKWAWLCPGKKTRLICTAGAGVSFGQRQMVPADAGCPRVVSEVRHTSIISASSGLINRHKSDVEMEK